MTELSDEDHALQAEHEKKMAEAEEAMGGVEARALGNSLRGFGEKLVELYALFYLAAKKALDELKKGEK